MAPRLDVKPLAKAAADKILAGESVPYLKWLDGNRRVRVLIGELIPNDGYKQTIQDRRKRFTSELINLLSQEGWEVDPCGGWHTYRQR